MDKREILDTSGRNTGERLAQYVWRSKPTQDPTIGRPVRCVVAMDEKGQYWAATRIGSGNGKKAQTEFWEAFSTKDRAVFISRDQTRSFLATHAELCSTTVTGKKPGEEIVKITMDDGWSVAINAPGRITPGERRVMALLDMVGKGKHRKPKSPGKAPKREGPSR